MARPILDDELWKLIEPLLPPPKKRRRRNPGRKPKDNRSVLTGILFVLKTGIPWEYLPKEMGCGSGMTCWRRLRDWQEAGVWEKIRRVLLQRLEDAEQIDWSRVVVDSTSVRAVFGGADWPESHRSPQSGLETSRSHRCQRHPAGHDVDGSQCSRRNAIDPAGGGDSQNPWQARTAATPQTCSRRSSVRFRTPSQAIATAWHSTGAGQTQHRAR